jgi:hypothetical protein
MITINVITVNEVKYLTGKIGKTAYSVEFSEESRDALNKLNAKYAACTTKADADAVLADAELLINSSKELERESGSLVSVLGGDLMLNKKTNTYHLVSDGIIAERPISKFFVNKMIEANEKGISPKPWLKFWVRLMRNPLYRDNKTKVKQIIEYLKATYVDEEAIKARVEEGYSEAVARELCTFDQISITEEGILAAFKYVALADDKFVVKVAEDGTQEIVREDRYKRVLEVNDVTGEITKDELALPEEAEDFVFLPPVQGLSGDEFTCAPIDTPYEDAPKGHIIKVGNVHELAKGFDQVNTNDNQACVKGLHLGGYYYVQNYGGQTKFLLDCLVSPEDIGAVADLSNRNSEGAIRCRRYMAVGAHFQVSRGMYHPSRYGALVDSDWEAMKKELLEGLKAEANKIEAID